MKNIEELAKCFAVSKDYEGMSLRASESFCKISVRVQERLARDPLISLRDIRDFDEQLRTWWGGLHPLFRESGTTPETLKTARGLLRCRFWTLRLTLYRPCLLNAALKQKHSRSCLTTVEIELVRKTGDIALETMEGIVRDWFPNQVSAWNSVWHIFQAALSLLVTLSALHDDDKAGSWIQGIETIIETLKQMQPWSTGACRSLEVVQLLFRGVRATREPYTCTTPQDLLEDSDYMNLLERILNDETHWFDIDSFSISSRSPEGYHTEALVDGCCD